MVAFASSLDQAGPLTRTVQDAAILLTSMAGHDPKDSTSIDKAAPNFEAAMTGDIKGLRIGIPLEYRIDNMPVEIEKLWSRGMEMLKDAGAELVDVSLPHTKYALPTYYIVAPAEASSNLARYDGVAYGHRTAEGGNLDALIAHSRAEGFGPEVTRRLLLGTYALSSGYYDAYYLKAQKGRTLVRQDFDQAFARCDVIAR